MTMNNSALTTSCQLLLGCCRWLGRRLGTTTTNTSCICPQGRRALLHFGDASWGPIVWIGRVPNNFGNGSLSEQVCIAEKFITDEKFNEEGERVLLLLHARDLAPPPYLELPNSSTAVVLRSSRTTRARRRWSRGPPRHPLPPPRRRAAPVRCVAPPLP